MTDTPAPDAVYRPAVDSILTRLLGSPSAVADLRRTAEAPGSDALTALLHDAALCAGEQNLQLARKIKQMRADLEAAARELAVARPAEQLLTARHDELLSLAARHHDALTHLEKIAQAFAATRAPCR